MTFFVTPLITLSNGRFWVMCYKQCTRVVKIDTETVLQTVHRHFQNRY
jgi:hypothetical protein